MSGKTMAQRMGTDPSEPLIARRPRLERLEKTLACHRTAQPRDEDRRIRTHRQSRTMAFWGKARELRLRRFLARRQISAQCTHSRAAERHDAFFAPFTEHNYDFC